jgi:hypothetical protein
VCATREDSSAVGADYLPFKIIPEAGVLLPGESYYRAYLICRYARMLHICMGNSTSTVPLLPLIISDFNEIWLLCRLDRETNFG